MSTLIICVNYGSDDETARYVGTLGRLQRAAELLDVVVVDNTPREAPLKLDAGALGPRLSVIAPAGNLGYFGGAAFGLRRHLETHPWPDVCAISNVDLEIGQPDFLVSLERAGAPGVGVIAPRIRSSLSGNDLNPYLVQRPSAARMRAYLCLYSWYPAFALYQRLAMAWSMRRSALRPREPAGARAIYAPHGSFIALTREFFARGGRLEYGAFLFLEELFIAEQAREVGLSVQYRPELEVVHHEHASVGRYRSPAMVAHSRTAAAYIVREYFS